MLEVEVELHIDVEVADDEILLLNQVENDVLQLLAEVDEVDYILQVILEILIDEKVEIE